MNLNHLIRLSSWDVVGAAYFCLTMTVQAQTLSVTGGQKDEGIRRRNLATDLIARPRQFLQAGFPRQRTHMRTSPLSQGVTRVIGVTVNQTESGLELILETATRSERLVPLILPQGNNLIIDILDATLAFSIRSGVTELNPAPGISQVTVNQGDENSIQVRITGENQTPSAEVVPGRNDLVLSIAPEGTTAETEPDEEIEVIATGEAEDDNYNFTDASVGTRTDTPTRDVPQSIQVVPQEVIQDQQVNNVTDALRNVPGILPADSNRTLFNNVTIRGFGGGFDFGTDVYRRNGLRDPQGASNTGDTANIERIEVLKGPSSVLYGQGSPGGIINLVTKQPLSEPFYEVSGEIGNYNFYRGTVDLSGPLDKNEKLLYRLNVAAETSESFIDFYDRDRFLNGAHAPSPAKQALRR